MLHRVVAASVRLLLFQPLGLAWHSEHQATEAGFAYNRISIGFLLWASAYHWVI